MAQRKLPEVYMNHFFIVLDSTTYAKLSDSSLQLQNLGNLKVKTVNTAGDSWSGKYLYGKNGYFEFFSKKGYEGAAIGDCGLGFITGKSNDISIIEKNWKEKSHDSLGRDTAMFMVGDKAEPWYYSIYNDDGDTLSPFATWLMENTPEELLKAGFSEDEIRNEITWDQYAAKRNKQTFIKPFNRIKEVELTLNQKEYDYLKKSLLGFGFREKKNAFVNNSVEIKYSIDERFLFPLKKVEIELTGTFPEGDIKISDHLIIHVRGKAATWEFSY